jgi:hypothetical protein
MQRFSNNRKHAPSHDPPMRSKTWRFKMPSQMMKHFEQQTKTCVCNGPDDIMDG